MIDVFFLVYSTFYFVMLCIELLSYKCHFCSDFVERGLIFVNMKLVFLLLIAVQLEIAVTCPLNCICEETETTCTLESCTDEISLDYMDFFHCDWKTMS